MATAKIIVRGSGGTEFEEGDVAHYPDVEAGEVGTTTTSLPVATPRQQRLVSLDVFRGITVTTIYSFSSCYVDGKMTLPLFETFSKTHLMILVDDVGGLVPTISHSPWDGATLADFVFPFFLFAVGVSLAFTYKRVPNRVLATKKAVLRAAKLFLLGLLLQGGFFHSIYDLTFGVDIRKMRLMGVLQRIAMAYLAAALCEIWLKGGGAGSSDRISRKYRHQLLVGLVLTVTYTVILYGLHVPDWEYDVTSPDSTVKHFAVQCGVRSSTGPGCNAVGMIDRRVLGIQHLYTRPVYLKTERCSIASPRNGPLPSDAPPWCQAPFDPEGLLSSLMATVTCLVGLQFGHVIVHFKEHDERMVWWSIPALSLLALGISLDFFGLRMNKSLYSLSYTCVTSGTAGLFYAGIYLLVDVYGYKRLAFPMEWIGKHALMFFVLLACNVAPILLQGFYWREPNNSLLKLIGTVG